MSKRIDAVTITSDMTHKDVRKLIRPLLPACTSVMRHARAVKREGKFVASCTHKPGARVVG